MDCPSFSILGLALKHYGQSMYGGGFVSPQTHSSTLSHAVPIKDSVGVSRLNVGAPNKVSHYYSLISACSLTNHLSVHR